MQNKKGFQNIECLYRKLEKSGVINPEYSKDQMITLLSPATSLHYIIENLEKAKDLKISSILVISENYLSSFNNGESFKITKFITGKEKLNVAIKQNMINEVLLDSLLSLDHADIEEVHQVNNTKGNYQFIYWPQPNIGKTSINLDELIKSHHIVTSHGSDIERAYESLLLGFNGLEIRPHQDIPDNKNPFSIRTESHSWGCIFGRIVTREKSYVTQNNIKYLEKIIPCLFDNIIELATTCGETIYTFGHFRYPLITLLCDYAININDRAIFKRIGDSEYSRVGNISEFHAKAIEQTKYNKEAFLTNVINMILSFGLPFATNREEQLRIEKILIEESNNGFDSASLTLAAFWERQGKHEQAYKVMELHTNNPYCLYNCACINIQKLANTEKGICQLVKASSIGFIAAKSALLQLSQADESSKIYIESIGVSLSELYSTTLQMNDPETLKIEARIQARKGNLISTEDCLFRASRQGDSEGIQLLLSLYNEIRINGKLTKEMKKRKKALTKIID